MVIMLLHKHTFHFVILLVHLIRFEAQICNILGNDQQRGIEVKLTGCQTYNGF